ncbi:MAG: ABC transporter ATP-binding protein [Bacteriovoracaceae bacterium]|nr:ABC transporter ATP-binding protein [Bacteriovoracaceae bacterium]
MNSISVSDTVLKIEKLNIVFNSYVYRRETIRDRFVRAVGSPLSSLRSNKNQLHVLKDFNLEVKKGERLGILGHNGSGKTTLCRCIAGMLIPSTGRISVNGTRRSIFNTTIGIIPELTGRENAYLLSVLMFPELENDERNDLLEEALEFSELGDFLDTPYMHYSKGMQARLCLSVISSNECDLLILDEVFDGADMFFQEKIAKRVLNLIKNSGAVVFVSHNLEQIRTACNQVMVIDGGNAWFKGDVEEGIKLYTSRGH